MLAKNKKYRKNAHLKGVGIYSGRQLMERMSPKRKREMRVMLVIGKTNKRLLLLRETGKCLMLQSKKGEVKEGRGVERGVAF